jgi:hypothetical protein
VGKDATVAQRVMDHRSRHLCAPLGTLLVQDDDVYRRREIPEGAP